MTVAEIKSEMRSEEYEELLEKYSDLMKGLLEEGFMIVTESSYMDYHKNIEKTRTHRYLGVQWNGEVKRLKYKDEKRKLRHFAEHQPSDIVVQFEPKESGEGEFVEAKRLSELEPGVTSRLLTPLLDTIRTREQAANYLKEKNQRLKEFLMKLV